MSYLENLPKELCGLLKKTREEFSTCRMFNIPLDAITEEWDIKKLSDWVKKELRPNNNFSDEVIKCNGEMVSSDSDDNIYAIYDHIGCTCGHHLHVTWWDGKILSFPQLWNKMEIFKSK